MIITQNNVHPLIDKLKVSNKIKTYFDKLEFHKIIQDSIFISILDNQNEEALNNYWSFTLEKDFIKREVDSINKFYNAIIDSRLSFINEHYPKTTMVFYTWYESISGNFNFSLVRNLWQDLPFQCSINQVKSLDDIIQEFINDTYSGMIPISAIECSEREEIYYEEDEQNEYFINVWSTILPR